MIFLVLLIGLIHAVIYLYLIPPWQHYDEPGNLEYAWLIADRARLPTEGEYDQGMRRETAASMIEHDFFKNLNFRPNLLSTDQPIWIGYSQLFGLPLYYILVALPLRLVRFTDITFQLYTGRIVSLLLYLITIVAAYGIVRAITPKNHPLRWLVPLSLALLPGFVDLMTAVNDDVGATAAFSLFLWAGVLIISKGFSWLRIAALLVTAAACALTKNTVIIAIILAMIPILITLFKKIRRRYLWAGILILGIISVFVVIRRGDAASWQRDTSQRLSTNVSRVDAPIGRDNFQFSTSKGIFQLVPQSDLSELKGKEVTLAAWMWADSPMAAQTPSIQYNGEAINQVVNIGRKPAFHAFITSVPENIGRLIVALQPGEEPAAGSRVYYDGVILVQGDYSQGGIPSARNIDASLLEWNGATVKNYVRNASAESTWFVVRPVVDRLLDYYVPGAPDLYLSLLQDWRSATWYYRLTFKNLFQTFWAKFGWGHVPLVGRYSYYPLALITLVGIIGAILSLTRQWRDLPINAYLFLFLAGMIIWIFAILRGLTSILEILFIPAARYAYPAIIPTLLALNMGWLEIGQTLLPKSRPAAYYILFVCFFILLDAIAVYSIIHYYYV